MDVLCMACKRTVPDEFPLCIQCGAPLQGGGAVLPAVPVRAAATVVPSKPPPPAAPAAKGPDPEKLKIDAKARVMWGEPRSAIRADLVRQGWSGREVDRALDDAVRERKAHFRSTGMREILTGSSCLGGFVLIFGGLFLAQSAGGFRILSLGRGFLILFLLPPLGLFFLIRGITRVIGAGEGEGGASDLDEGD